MSNLLNPKKTLIDVRTPAEFSTGFLTAITTHTPVINIEYQLISQLPIVLADHGIELQKEDPITLYCRSGRRSNIALQELRELGYRDVRDIGGFEYAREVLEREEAGAGAVLKEGNGLQKGGVFGVEVEVSPEDEGRKKEERKEALGKLLTGLKQVE